MNLIVESAVNKNSDMIVSIPKGGFIIRSTENELKKLKIGNRFYLYVDDVGEISHLGGLFKHEPTRNDVISQSAFKDAATASFSLEPKRTSFGTQEQQDLHKESMGLFGSRLSPSFIQIDKIKLGETKIGERTFPYAFITGKVNNVKDARLDYLSDHEETTFGKGQFDIDDVRALPNGKFLYLSLTPYAEQIERLVEEQVEAFNHYSSLYGSESEEKADWVSKYEHTRKLLKPHAGEIYKYKDGFIYYINSGGNWQVECVYGMRKLDIVDRERIYQHLVQTGEVTSDLKEKRQLLSSKPFLEQRKLDHIAHALQPHVTAERKKDSSEIDRLQKKLATLKPTDGPLGVNDLSGLRKGVDLFPHQSMVLASLKERDRMLVDADPGAGKALTIICDVLQQMRAGKLQRPLVVMPESLMTQFAQEVKRFSELNPWIISTDSIKKWGKTRELPEFIEDAKRAPRNTIYLTSYTWLSLDPELVDNGEITEGLGKIGYRKIKVFNRPSILLKRLGVDAVYMDECHLLRGNSNKARAASALSEAPIVRGLTGTVMAGNPYDAVAPMSYIHSSVFGTQDDFINEYTASGSIHDYKKEAPKKIRSRLKGFGVVPVRKSAWMHLLPTVHRQVHYAEFSPDQKKAYAALLANIMDEIRNDPRLSALLKRVEESLKNGEEIDAGPLLARFTPLDVFLNSPSEAKDWLKGIMLGENAVSPKAKIISSIIHKHLAMPNAGKILVFVQYKEAAKNLLEHLDESLKAQADYYEGGMTGILTRFKSPQDPLKILFAVDKSLVMGHNLQVANCIIHADVKWMFGDMFQREARAARNGQTRDVYIHTVLMRGSAEVLKMARVISAEHLIAKANSDFTDDTVLQPVRMTLSNMQAFTEEHQLSPYIERKQAIESGAKTQSEKEKDVYGPTMVRPHGYTPITKTFAEAKELKKVPSSHDFSGDERDLEELTEQDIEDLPEDPKHPKLLNLGLMQWDNDWYIYSYKSADPDGFLRKLGFSLMRGYYYVEIPSKSSVDNLINRLEKTLKITNKLEFERQVRETRVITQGVKEGLKKAAQKARQNVAAKAEVSPDYIDKSKAGEIELQFGVVDGTPVVWTHAVLDTNDPELPAIKRAGFTLEPPLWRRLVTRSLLKLILKKLQDNYPQARIANWDQFKDISHMTFKGLDLTEFDSLALAGKKS